MLEIRIPFAVDDQERLYCPTTAEKGKSYFCPACQGQVILKQGEIRTAHFAHQISNICSQETVIHKTAKLLIQRVVYEWKSGKSNPPIFQRTCQICDTSVSQFLPEKVDDAVLEYKLADGSIADIALLVREIAQAAVEIKVTHAVDEIKANRLSVPFIELDGYEVIESPTIWKPITDNFKPLICGKCKSVYQKFQLKINQISEKSHIKLPTTYYRHGFCICWKCKREIVVFAWPKDGIHDDSAPKVKPPPRTIQYRFSKTAGHKYWVNTCPYCQSIQGDFFLYNEPSGPFFAVNINVFEKNSSITFKRDMMKIAQHVAQMRLI